MHYSSRGLQDELLISIKLLKLYIFIRASSDAIVMQCQIYDISKVKNGMLMCLIRQIKFTVRFCQT